MDLILFIASFNSSNDYDALKEKHRPPFGHPCSLGGSEVTFAHEAQQVRIHVTCRDGHALTCPQCDVVCPGYDNRRRQWRHLDMCAYRTMVVADHPRVACPEHGVRTVSVPWAEPKARFTAEFESLVIDSLQEASVSAVSRLMGVSWNAIDKIMQCAVERGLARREDQSVVHIGVDETSFRKRHDYVTIVSYTKSGTVLHVGQDRKKETLTGWYAGLSLEQLEGIRSVSMDMWQPISTSRWRMCQGQSRRWPLTGFMWPNAWGLPWTRCGVRSTAH